MSLWWRAILRDTAKPIIREALFAVAQCTRALSFWKLGNPQRREVVAAS